MLLRSSEASIVFVGRNVGPGDPVSSGRYPSLGNCIDATYELPCRSKMRGIRTEPERGARGESPWLCGPKRSSVNQSLKFERGYQAAVQLPGRTDALATSAR